MMMFWIAYWIFLLAAATAAISRAIFWYAHAELDDHDRELKQRIRQAELACLRTKSTQSRIKSRPDL